MTDMSLPPARHFLPADRVINAFASVRQIDRNELLLGETQTRPITQARHLLMWLLRDLTAASVETIGNLIGGRDQSTAWNAIRGVADRLAADVTYRASVNETRRQIIDAVLAEATPAPSRIGDGRSIFSRAAMARGILADTSLSDADARTAALILLNQIGARMLADLGGGATHG